MLTRRGQRGADTKPGDVRRIEERVRGYSAATQEWLTLLQEMERAGQTADPRYDAYFQAYLQARQQEKRAELDLFNVRRGLRG